MILCVIAQLFFFQGMAAGLSAIEIPKDSAFRSMRNGEFGPADRMESKLTGKFFPQSISESILGSVAPAYYFRLIPEAPFEVSIDEKLFSRILAHAYTFSADLAPPVANSSRFPEPLPQVPAKPTDPLESFLKPGQQESAIELPQSNETKEAVSRPLKKAEDPEDQFASIVIKAAREYSVDPAIIKAIIKAESGYNPKAVSNRGAKGLMQLMPNTAKSLGVEDVFCPEQNILAGVKYFKQLLNEFDGNTKLALAAYNSGSRKVKEYKGIPPFKTTRLYIKKVFEYHQEYSQQIAEEGLNPLNAQAFSSFSSF